jgi:hypothetical protein
MRMRNKKGLLQNKKFAAASFVLFYSGVIFVPFAAGAPDFCVGKG